MLSLDEAIARTLSDANMSIDRQKEILMNSHARFASMIEEFRTHPRIQQQIIMLTDLGVSGLMGAPHVVFTSMVNGFVIGCLMNEQDIEGLGVEALGVEGLGVDKVPKPTIALTDAHVRAIGIGASQGTLEAILSMVRDVSKFGDNKPGFQMWTAALEMVERNLMNLREVLKVL
jgi:hypothetical protein